MRRAFGWIKGIAREVLGFLILNGLILVITGTWGVVPAVVAVLLLVSGVTLAWIVVRRRPV